MTWHRLSNLPWDSLGIAIGAVVAALVIARLSRSAAVWLSVRYERRRAGDETGSPADTGALISLKRYETTVSLIHTTIRYIVFAIAFGVVLYQLIGPTRSATLAGASLLVLLIGFSAQRFLTDIIAGVFMFLEGWFAVGDTITIEPWGLAGVVDEVSLRSTTLRSVTGETIRVHNSQILATRRLPRGVREAEIELFVNDEPAGRRLFEEVAPVVPFGSTRFVRRPAVRDSERLDEHLYRITAVAAVAHGREWLVDGFLPDLLKERAEPGLIVHGPVVMFVDEQAVSRFARAVPRVPVKG
ncbi:MAG: moderate conductance mechanosensitive channel [Gaiellales bacterium]|jgi:small conductance mechanosensitive channel|nr:moderate conductance mechanosensitive channel [Gaiellales bacterium]MDX6550495.1 moderate conductance mechanosensitive channel [Gaiellales bacterium]